MADNRQLIHENHKTSSITFPLHIVASDINSPLNIGSLFRLCDALGIEKLYLCGSSATPPGTKINKTSRSTEKYVDYESGLDAATLITRLKNENFIIIALEISSTSLALNDSEFISRLDKDKPVCLVLGSEKSGISDELLALTDMTTHIPMFGHNSSMNVISAASIASYCIINQLWPQP